MAVIIPADDLLHTVSKFSAMRTELLLVRLRGRLCKHCIGLAAVAGVSLTRGEVLKCIGGLAPLQPLLSALRLSLCVLPCRLWSELVAFFLGGSSDRQIDMC